MQKARDQCCGEGISSADRIDRVHRFGNLLIPLAIEPDPRARVPACQRDAAQGMLLSQLLQSVAIHRERLAEGSGDDRPLIVVQLESVGSSDRFADHAVIVEVCSQVDIEDAP